MTSVRVPNVMASKAVRRVDLTEWESRDVLLSSSEVADILRCPPSVLQVATLPGGFCRLTPGAVIGRLRLGTVDLRILPKCPMPSLLAMLVEVHELARLTPDFVGYETSPEIIDLMVQIFLHQVERVIRQGLRRTYIREEEELVAVRGRIDLQSTVDLHLRGKARVQCRFEEYTFDGPENGTLLAALHAIASNQALPAIRRNRAHQMKTAFPDVRPSRGQSIAQQVTCDRLNLHYHPTLQLAELILKGMGILQEFGIADANGFLLNMNQLFEGFVCNKLQKIMLVDQVKVRRQKQSPFDVGRQAVIKPDMIIQSHHGRRIVADTKYKFGTTPKPSDLYQMFTYCRVLNLTHGVLITVGSGDSKRYEVLDGTTTIEVIPVDLSGNLLSVDKSIRSLATRLLELLEVVRPKSGSNI